MCYKGESDTKHCKEITNLIAINLMTKGIVAVVKKADMDKDI